MKAPRRLGLWIPWGLFALFAIAWTIYWNVLAHAARANIDAAIATERARGAEVQIGAMNGAGFPLQYALELRDVSYAAPRRDLSVMTQRLVVHVNVLNPQHVIVAFPTPLAITQRSGQTRLTGATMLMSVHTARGALVRASFEGDALVLDDPAAQDGGARIAKAVLHLRPDARAAGDYQLAAHVEGVALKAPVKGFEPLGNQIAAIDAGVVLNHLEAFTGRADGWTAWAAAGGRARLEGFTLNWGAARGSGQGELALDAERRLTGRATIRLNNPAATLRALSDGPQLSHDAKQALQIAALAYAVSGDAIEIPLSARDGALYLGPARVRELKPL